MDGLVSLQCVRRDPELELWTGGSCRLELREAAPGVFLTVASGRVGLGMVEPMLARMDRIVALPSWPHVYFDLEGVTGYDKAIVDPVRRWTKAHRHDLGAMHLYTRSRIVRGAIALVSYKLPGVLFAHRERRSFEASLRRAREAG